MARILVIEDNPTNLELMIYLLEAFGHAPISACDGEQGLKLAEQERPDLILCDVQIPRYDGYEVARRLKADPVLSRIPRVAVTALAMVGDRDRMLGAGFDGYISKPIVPEMFVAQVEQFLQPEQQSPAGPARQENLVGKLDVPPVPVPKDITILVVDDSAINISLARSTLEPYGYRIVEAKSVSEALTVAKADPPDLILSDLHMRGEDGFELIWIVKDDPVLRSIPFAFVTSTVWREEDRTRGLALGATKFILRPIKPQQLLREVEVCLKKSDG